MSKKEIVRIGALKDVIASGIRVGDMIMLSGQVSVDDAGEVVGPGDIAAQMAQAYRNVKDVLQEFDAGMEHIVDETWFVTDVNDVMAKARSWAPIRNEAFGGRPDTTQTLIGITALVYPELMIEIKCIAHLQADD